MWEDFAAVVREQNKMTDSSYDGEDFDGTFSRKSEEILSIDESFDNSGDTRVDSFNKQLEDALKK